MGHYDRNGGEAMTLNRAQRIILGLGGCLLLMMFLLPPWIESRGRGANLGYGFLFAPPGYFPTIDFARLFLQTAAIVTGTALLVWWFHSHQASAQSPPKKTSERSIMQKAWNTSFKLPRFEADQWLGRSSPLPVARCSVSRSPSALRGDI